MTDSGPHLMLVGEENDPLGLRLSGIVLAEKDKDKDDLSSMDLDFNEEDEIDDKEMEMEMEEDLESGPLDDDNWSEIDDASFDSEEAREAAIRDGFLGFLIDYVKGHLFQKFLGWAGLCWAWIMKKICRGDEDDDDNDALVQEAVEVTEPMNVNMFGGGFGGPAPPGMPPGVPGIPFAPPPGVVEMAAAASQSAASAGAAGASAGAGAAAGAAGAAGSAAAGLAGAVASAGVAGQVGAAVGVAAVTAAAISAGFNMPINATQHDFVPVPYEDNFVPPVCSMDSLLKEGYVELHIKGLPPTVFPEEKYILELLFR
jgi:hypothetical protein